MKHNRIATIISLIGLAALLILLNVSSPTEAGPLGVLLFFTTLYITLFSIFTLIQGVFYRLAFGRKELKTKDYLYTAVLSFGPIMLLMARSFSAINFWTISLILIFIALAEFLVKKRAR